MNYNSENFTQFLLKPSPGPGGVSSPDAGLPTKNESAKTREICAMFSRLN